jgi:hypothetical protein
MDEPILTLTQIAERADYTRQQIWNKARKGEIPAQRANPGRKHYRFIDSPKLRAWCAERAARRARSRARNQAREEGRLSRLDPVAQDMWRKLRAKERLSPRELQESIRLGRPTRIKIDRDKNRGIGFTSFEIWSGQWKLLRRQIEDTWRKWPDDTIEEALRFIEPVESFARELRRLRRAESDHLA